MIQIAVNDIEKDYSFDKVLNGVNIEVQENERIGLVGKNGSGKTTLFKIIMGIESKDKGDIFIRKGAKLGYVEQIPDYEENITVREVLQMAFDNLLKQKEEIHLLEKEMESVSAERLDRILLRYGEISDTFERQGGYEIEEQINRMCEGLQFKVEFLEKKFMNLSGGEKTTVLLGKVLLENPDILLLDEPTNHLDVKSIEWLESYLRGYSGTVLMISHDRYFLDQVATKIIELERGKVITYLGNYSAYTIQKERILLAEFEAYEDQQKQITAMKKAIKRLRMWAAQGDNEDLFKRAAAMQKRLDRMEKLDKPILEAPQIKLEFSTSERSGNDVISVRGVSKAYGYKQLFKNLEWDIRYQEHVALIGENGCGKSTLIKMLFEEVIPDEGEIRLGSGLKIAYLPQQIQFADEEMTVLESFKEDIVMPETQARQTLAKFLFYGESVFKKLKGLSGGEKSRLYLCKLIQQDINLLILDEPTNHLDIESRENLEEALQNFKGTLIFISHDRYFINKLATRVSEMNVNGITNYIGNYEYYKEKRNQAIAIESQSADKQLTSNKQRQNIDVVNNARYAENPTKKLDCINTPKVRRTVKSQYKINQLEEQIKELEDRLDHLRMRMQNIGSDYMMYMELEDEANKVQFSLEQIMETWIELQES